MSKKILSIRIHVLIFAIVCISSMASYGQFTPIWDEANDPSALDDDANAVAVDETGIYVAGFDVVPGNQQFRIDKRSLTSGALIPSFGSAGTLTINPSVFDDVANGIATDTSGIYVTGAESLCLGCDAKWYIQKRDRVTGDFDWVQVSNPSVNPDMSTAIAIDTSGIYVVGTVGISFLNWAWRIEKRDLATGALIWGHTNDVSILGDTPYSVAVDETGVYTVGFDYIPGNQGWRIEKRDLVTGLIIWEESSDPSSGDDYATSVIADANGIYVTGADMSNGSSNAQWRIEKRDAGTGALVPSFGTNGILISNPSSGVDEASALSSDLTGLYVAGADNIVGNRQWRLEKRDLTTGALACSTLTNPSANADHINAMINDASGIYLAGTDRITSSNEWRVEKFDLCDVSVSVGFNSPEIGISIFPNPATSQFTIEHKGISSGEIEVFDGIGRSVEQQVLKSERTVVHTDHLPAGIYLVRIESGDRQSSWRLFVD